MAQVGVNEKKETSFLRPRKKVVTSYVLSLGKLLLLSVPIEYKSIVADKQTQ